MPKPQRHHGVGIDLVATGALILFHLAVAAGFARVFVGWSFLQPLTTLILTGHGLSFVLRRLRVPGWATYPVLGVLLLWLIAQAHLPRTLRYRLPTGATFDRIDIELAVVADQFRTAVAPVGFADGWALWTFIVIAAVVLVGDGFAFAAGGTGEALVPGGVVFIILSALAGDEHRVSTTAVLVTSAVVAGMVLREYHRLPARVAEDQRGRHRIALGATTILVAAITTGTGLAIGPRIPGANQPAWIDTTDGMSQRTTVSNPLVEIRSSLRNQSPLTMFTVSSSAATYWRVTSLPHFDGSSFSLGDADLATSPAIDRSNTPGVTLIRQDVTIDNLGDRLVPAAPDPIEVDTPPDDADSVLINPDTSSLVLVNRFLERGDKFSIVSAVPSITSIALAGRTSNSPSPAFVYLPSDLPSLVEQTTDDVLGETSNPYASALALQHWFRQEFEYSLEVTPGHGGPAISSFLENRVGYCEQFAATYAAMLRTRGIPTRVAVGFTSGDFDGQRYIVTGKHAHAWPEVWFDGIGWVGFEPTPNRGAPGAEAYTGVTPQQESVSQPASSTTVPAPERSTSDSSVPTSTVPAAPPTPPSGPHDTAEPPASAPTAPRRNLPVVPLLVVAVLAAVLGLPAIIRAIRRNPRRADGVREQIIASWGAGLRASYRAGLPPDPSRTPTEVAAALTQLSPPSGPAIYELASLVEVAVYGRPQAAIEASSDESDDPKIGRGRRARQLAHMLDELHPRTLSDKVADYFRSR